MTDLRVLHVLTTNQRRGAESFAYTLAGELGSRGLETCPVALVPAASEPCLPVRTLGRTRALGLLTLIRLHRHMAHADVVIAHGSRTLPATVFARGLSRVPIVYVNIGDPQFWANTPRRHWRVSQLLRRVQAIAARTESSARVLASSFGVPRDNIAVIGNARSALRFRPASDDERAEARQRFGAPMKGPVVASVGALAFEKRVDVAIDAMAHIASEAHLLVAGEGPLRAELEKQADRVAPGRVHFVGQVEDPSAVYHASDIVVLTSDSEGLPGVLIEAGLSGLPVVATDVGFVSDVVALGLTGELVPPGEPTALASALDRVLRVRSSMGPAAREHCVDAFDIDVTVDRWVALLEKVTE